MARHEINHIVQIYQGCTVKPAVGAQVLITTRPSHGAVQWYASETGGVGQSGAVITDDLGRINAWVDPGKYYLEVTLNTDPVQTYSQPFDLGADLPGRRPVTVTTASLANSAEASASVTMGPGARVINLATTVAARVRVYADTTSRTADAARAVGVEPNSANALLLEVITTSGDLSVWLSPSADLHTADGGTDFPALVQNLSGGAVAVGTTFTYLPTEV